MDANTRYKLRDGCAFLTINTPKNGVLGAEGRAALAADIKAAVEEPDVTALVLLGARRTFPTATDFDIETGNVSMSALCDLIENLPMPVVAVIEGAAMAAGLELALAAHFRLSAPKARLGFPDIVLGMVPGAGGTQRCPRLVGGTAALTLLLGGRSIDGNEALSMGLVDGLTDEDPVSSAIAFLDHISQSNASIVPTRGRRDRFEKGSIFLERVAKEKKKAEASALLAPARMVECVESALLLPFETGCEMERVAFEDLRNSDQFKALRHIVHLEMKMTHAARRDNLRAARPLKKIAVVGVSGLGAEMAVASLDAGYSVIAAEQSDEHLEAGVVRIIEAYDAKSDAGKITESQAEETLDRLQAVCGFKTISDADLVLDMSPRPDRRRIMELDGAMRAGAVLATGLNGAGPQAVGGVTSRPSDVVALRAFGPLGARRVLELAGGVDAGSAALDTAKAFLKSIRKMPVLCGAGSPGVGAHLLLALHAAADLCLEDGATVTRIDTALKELGLPLGSFAWRDADGIVSLGGSQSIPPPRGFGLDAALVAQGHTGRIAGQGYYIYTPGAEAVHEAPMIATLAEQDRSAKGVAPRAVGSREIQLRCVAAMAGAGAQLLVAGHVQTPADIDLISVHSLGIARRTGGVMKAADLMGLAVIKKSLTRMASISPRIASPSPLFQELIKNGQGFSDLNAGSELQNDTQKASASA